MFYGKMRVYDSHQCNLGKTLRFSSISMSPNILLLGISKPIRSSLNHVILMHALSNNLMMNFVESDPDVSSSLWISCCICLQWTVNKKTSTWRVMAKNQQLCRHTLYQDPYKVMMIDKLSMLAWRFAQWRSGAENIVGN